MKKSDNPAFDAAYEKLREWVYKNELQRRVWAKEVWTHPSGRLWKTARVLTPIFSLFSVVSLFIYCYIREMQMMMQQMLSYEPNTAFVEVLMALAIVSGIAIITGNVLLFLKKYRSGGMTCGISAVVSLALLTTQLAIPMGNADQFRLFCFISMGMYFVLAVCSLYIPILLIHERRQIEKMTQSTLSRISSDSKELLSPEEYTELIEQYLEDEKLKVSEHRQKMKRKRAQRD